MDTLSEIIEFAFGRFINLVNIKIDGKKSYETEESSKFLKMVDTERIYQDPSKDNQILSTRSENNGSEEIGLNSLPIEIFCMILEKMDVNTLKLCREVSKDWNQLITKNQSIINRICISNFSEKSTFSTLNFNEEFQLKSLRLKNLFSYWNPKIFHNIMHCLNGNNLNAVTWLEIYNNHLNFKQLLDILEKFTNLHTLKITGETVIHLSNEEEILKQRNYVLAKIRFQQLLQLTLKFEELHSFLIYLERVELIESIKNLEVLDLCGSSGNLTEFFRIGHQLEKLLIQNCKSLKIFNLDNFSGDVRGSLDAKLNFSKYRIRSMLYKEFPNFLLEMPWPSLIDVNCGIFQKLEEISLDRFPIANMNEPDVYTKLIPFVTSIKSLKRLTISQMYLSDDLNIQNILNKLPPTLKLQFTSVHLYVKNPNYDNITEVLHSEQNIIKYKNSSVNLGYLNIDWTIIYLTWSSILSDNFLMHNCIMHLKKFHLNEAAFSIGDAEMQYFIKEANLLEDLSFNCCNLSTLTDFGITGISHEALLKIRIDKKYEIKQQDYTNKPLQTLKHLRRLKLSNVGEHVTFVSIERSLGKLKALEHVVIHQNPMVIPMTVIENLRLKPGIKQVHYGLPQIVQD